MEKLLSKSMADWKTVLTSNGEVLGEVAINRGIFQGDSLSPLLFIIIMMPLSILLRREDLGYKLGPGGKFINHLLFMDDLKLYGRTSEQLERLVDVVEVYSRDIGMEFGLEKCAVLKMEGGVKVGCGGIELPSGEVMKEVEEAGYKYLGVLEGAGIKNKEMKEKVRGEYLRRVKLVAKSKLYGGNLIKGVNAWAVAVVRYSAGVLDWKEKELKAMDVRTRKLLTMCGVFHRGSSVDRLYLRRKDGGRGLISVLDCVREEEMGLCEYVGKSNEWMLMIVGESLEEVEEKNVYKKRVDQERKNRFGEKVLHGRYFRDVKEVSGERSWQWVRAGYMGKNLEGFVFAAQENVLKTRLYRNTILKEEVTGNCRVCGKVGESVGHLVSGCSGLAQREYKRRHDRMGLRVYWEVCRLYGVECGERWYEEVPDEVRRSKDGRYEVWWDKPVATAKRLEHNRPDLVVIDHREKEWKIVDFSVPWDKNVISKEDDKINNYSPLANEVRKMHRVSTRIVPIVVGALGTVSKR